MTTIRRAYLTVHGVPNDGMTVPLGGEPIVLGRSPDVHIVIDDASVSRQHALIMETPFGFEIRDLGSTNGTYVDGRRIGAAPLLLRTGATIRLGSKFALAFRQESVSTVVLRPRPLAGLA